MSVSLEQIEQILAIKIAKSIQISPNDTLLGFLDVDEDAQQAVLQFLRKRPAFATIKNYLQRYPALTSYGLAVAAPIGLQEEDVGAGAIYGAWQAAFGFIPSQSEREPLAHEFVLALERLGLEAGTISPDHDLHWMGGCYLFHGAILPHFVDPLSKALESAQKTRALPDPDDAERAAIFATFLADKVHPAQTRLRKTLRSPVGSFLVRRLSQWLVTKDSSLFPTHIQPLLEEQKVRGAFLHAPYIQFDETDGRMLLVLPAQTSNLADSGTRWTVAGRSYRAASGLPPVPLEDLGLDGEFDVTLTQLKDEREDCTYHLLAGIPLDRGFRVFDSGTGKERRFNGGSISHIIDFTPGQSYLVVLDEVTKVQSDHAEEEVGDFRVLRVEAAPGAEPVSIDNAGSLWTLRTKVRPGLYLTPSDDCRFQVTRATDGTNVNVSYGQSPDLTCAIPLDCETSARLHFSTKWDATLSESVDCPPGSAGEGVRLIDAGYLLDQWMAKLPPAVHAITVSLQYDGRITNQELVHWQGLKHVTIYGDFHCESLPANLASVTGFESKERSLLRPNAKGGKAEIGLTKLGQLETERWEVPANRVNMALLSTEGDSANLDEGAEIEVLPADDRIIQFRTGGLLAIRLTCGGTPIGEISTSRPLVSKFLTTLTAEHGRTGTLKAEALFDLPGERTWTVLRWRTPQTAKECRLEPSDVTQVVWLIRKVSISGIRGLRIKLFDFVAKLANADAEASIPLSIPDEVEATTEAYLGSCFSCSVRRKPDDLVQIRLCFDRAKMRGSIWITELECLLSDSTAWQPVMSREAHGRLAVIRLVFIGGTPETGESPFPLADLFWGKPTDPLPDGSPAWLLNGDQMESWLNAVRWLLACKYPTSVWHQNNLRFKSLYRRLTSICLRHGDDERAAWWTHAVSELQKHAADAQPVVMPCLLLSSNLKMAATSLKSCDLRTISDLGCVGKAFHEASLYQSRPELNDLAYIGNACADRRLNMDFLFHFTGWQHLLNNRPAKLGGFQYRDWSNNLAGRCLGMEPGSEFGTGELMSAAHFFRCLMKAKRRADVLLSISEQEHGHWLSGPISRIGNSSDQVLSAISAILGQRLHGAPAEVLFRPLTSLETEFRDPRGQEFLQSLIMACCLAALATRAKDAGILSLSQLNSHLRSIVSAQSQGPEVDEKIEDQIALILGTAPELFSFYFLLFTFSLSPNP